MIIYDLEELENEYAVRVNDNGTIKRVYFDLDFNFKEVEVLEIDGSCVPGELSDIDTVIAITKANKDFLQNPKNEIEIVFRKA